MDGLLGVEEVATRYRCTVRTARGYMREMGTVTTRPMLVTEAALMQWEQQRTAGNRTAARRTEQRTQGRMVVMDQGSLKPGQHISRTRPKMMMAK